MMIKYVLVFDGGSRGNPGRSYGSYRIKPPGGEYLPPVRLPLGFGTNNEAEYRSLIAGVKAVLEILEEKELDPAQIVIEICGDSNLVLNQLAGTWKAKNARMRELRDEAEALIARFETTRLIHHEREWIVGILGH
jgi:probable phosphoglycerate mutase